MPIQGAFTRWNNRPEALPAEVQHARAARRRPASCAPARRTWLRRELVAAVEPPRLGHLLRAQPPLPFYLEGGQHLRVVRARGSARAGTVAGDGACAPRPPLLWGAVASPLRPGSCGLGCDTGSYLKQLPRLRSSKGLSWLLRVPVRRWPLGTPPPAQKPRAHSPWRPLCLLLPPLELRCRQPSSSSGP